MKKQQMICLAAAGAALVLIVALALVAALGGGTEEQVIQKYYEAIYVQDGGSMEDILACLAPDLREDYYNQVTVGGTNFHQLSAWRMEALQMVGDQVRLEVSMMSTGADSASTLSQLRQQYPGAEQAHNVSFRIDMTGEDGSETFVGVLPMIRIDGQWYLLNPDAGLRRVVEDAGSGTDE